jgi:hypothetical protein
MRPRRVQDFLSQSLQVRFNLIGKEDVVDSWVVVETKGFHKDSRKETTERQKNTFVVFIEHN